MVVGLVMLSVIELNSEGDVNMGQDLKERSLSDILKAAENQTATTPTHETVDLCDGAQKVLVKMEEYADSSYGYGMDRIRKVREACELAEEVLRTKREALMRSFTSYIQALQVVDDHAKIMTQDVSNVVVEAERS